MTAHATLDGRCNVCGHRGPRSDEDVFPQWLRKAELQRLPSGTANRFPRIKLRVCAACNAMMNRKFEETARPLILEMRTGQRISLSPADQEAVGRWIVKTELLRCYHRLATRNDPSTTGTRLTQRQMLAVWRQMIFRLVHHDELPPATIVRAGIVAELQFSRRATALDFIPRYARMPNHTLSSVDGLGPVIVEALINFEDHDRLADRSRADCRKLAVLLPVSPTPLQWPPTPLNPDEAGVFHGLWGHDNPVPLVRDR